MFANNSLKDVEMTVPTVQGTIKDMVNHILIFSLDEQNEIISGIVETIKKDRLDSLAKLKTKSEELNASLSIFSEPI